MFSDQPEVVDRAVRQVAEHDEPVLLSHGPRLGLLAGDLVEDLRDGGHGPDVADAAAHHQALGRPPGKALVLNIISHICGATRVSLFWRTRLKSFETAA